MDIQNDNPQSNSSPPVSVDTNTVSETTQTVRPADPQSVYPQPVDSQAQNVMSANQKGINQPDKKPSNFKRYIVKTIVGIVILGVIFIVLVTANVVVFSRFKTVEYVNSKGSQYSLSFYARHSTKKLSSGNTQLVSKVSVENKYPITLSISSVQESNYSHGNCGNYTKLFEVQNDNLNQKLAVCELSAGQNSQGGVYVSGFLYNKQASIVSISQDLSGVNLSSQSNAQQSLTKFGLEPYKDDISKILASIKVE